MPSSSHLFLHLACCLFSILCTSTVVSGAFPLPTLLGIENGLYIGFIQPAVCVRIRAGPWSQRAATAGCLLSGYHKEYFDKDRGLRIGHVLPGMPLPTREWHSPSPSPQDWAERPTLICSAPLPCRANNLTNTENLEKPSGLGGSESAQKCFAINSTYILPPRKPTSLSCFECLF